MSSSTPSMTIRSDPMRMPRISRSISAKISTVTTKAPKMASPPSRGIGTLCIRRLSLGTSIAPTLTASFFTSGVAAKDSTEATRTASSIHRAK